MKILIGVDDSPHSRAALDYVKASPWPTGTTCVVISAVRPVVTAPTVMDAGGFTWVQAATKEMTQQAEEFTSRVERELQDAGLKTEARVVHGDPRVVLSEAADVLRADLLIVGSHGRSGFDKLMMGSVASHLVTHAPCTIMVVKLKK